MGTTNFDAVAAGNVPTHRLHIRFVLAYEEEGSVDGFSASPRPDNTVGGNWSVARNGAGDYTLTNDSVEVETIFFADISGHSLLVWDNFNNQISVFETSLGNGLHSIDIGIVDAVIGAAAEWNGVLDLEILAA